MTTASIRIDGLDRLRRISSTAPRIVDTEAKKGVREAATVIRTAAVKNARAFSIGSKFPSSIRYRAVGLRAEIGSLAATALSIEKGRRPGETVRFGLILGWIRRKGLLRGVVSLKTQKTRLLSAKKVAKRGIDRDERILAAQIVTDIRRRGTKPLAFLLPTLDEKGAQLRRIFQDVGRNAVRKMK